MSRAQKRAVVRELEDLGYRFRRQAHHSLLLAHPAGVIVGIPLTPSDHRSDRNSLAQARRQLRAVTTNKED